MARILQRLVCITVMMASASTQRDYSFYRQPRVLNDGGSHQVTISKRVAFEEEPKPKDVIVFQGPSTRRTDHFTPVVPDHCRKQGFCEDEPNYPTDAVKGILENLGDEVNKRFQVDKLDDTVQIAQRLGGAGADLEIELCNFTEKVIYPQSAPDRHDNWYTVINLKDKPVQGVRVEICNTTKSSCNGIATMQEGYTGGCKQKFFYRLLDVIDKDGKHVTKHLKLPSCCTCVVTVGDMPF